ncbi:MAG: ATPase [Lachnospiraceae bacterium]|uniref:ATPase n=1 Tax=Candidatus Weimeria bifida TaxID=2599074 RepID=A0A6N7IYV3_9FIRM|nr:ATPase [Candidatus Weimeria bifida]RRF96970.1 MAG: ATPase [Lachnospiraceae bacterium]
MANSEIEDIIDNIENYIDNCKTSMFSSTKISVDKEEMESLLEELRSRTPEEINRYRRLLKNEKAILENAHKQADAIVAEAKAKSNELMSENQIMQQAYAKANEVVNIAQKNANDIMTKATEQANNIQMSAIKYTDSLLSSVQSVLTASITTTDTRMKNFLGTMQKYLDTVNDNRAELSKVLNPAPAANAAPEEAAAQPKEVAADDKAGQSSQASGAAPEASADKN